MSENDIVPELLEKIMNDFEENVSLIRAEETFEALLKSNNLEDAYEIAREIGGALSESFFKFITEDILPNGRMYYNIANRIIPPTLQKAYKEAEEITEIIMSNILSKSKIGIKVQQGLLNQDRIRGIVDRLSEAENYQDVKFLTGKAVVQNVTQSAVDDTIEANAQFHYKSGLRAVVERKLGGKCCAWCRSLVGRYTYPNVPDDVYRRHEHCRCTVTYYPSKASRGQDVWSKKEVDYKNSRTNDQLGSKMGADNSLIDIDKNQKKYVPNRNYESLLQAKEFAKNNLGIKNIGFDAMETGDVLMPFLQKLESLKTQFGEMFTNISVSELMNNDIAMVTPDRRLLLNKYFFNSQKLMNDVISEYKSKQILPKGADISYVAAHEWAHYISQEELADPKSPMRTLFNRREAKNLISRNQNKNVYEFVADSIAADLCGINCKYSDKVVKYYLER